MDYKTILENWQKFAQSTKPLTLSERRDIMNEVSKNVADKIYDWMRETRGLDSVSYTHLTLPTSDLV